jgi:hypothetical protein
LKSSYSILTGKIQLYQEPSNKQLGFGGHPSDHRRLNVPFNVVQDQFQQLQVGDILHQTGTKKVFRILERYDKPDQLRPNQPVLDFVIGQLGTRTSSFFGPYSIEDYELIGVAVPKRRK